MATDYSTFNFGVSSTEEEEMSPIKSKYDSFDFTKRTPDLSELTYGQKAAYGATQETTIGGNILRMASAAVDAGTSEKSWSEALKDLEEQRQREIDLQFPEFRGLEESDEDLAILSGRLGVAVADPVTFAMPWLKAAKVGSTGARLAKTAGAYGATAAADTAIRDKVVYGDVNATNLAVSATVGSGSAILGLGLQKIVTDRLGRQINNVEPVPPVPAKSDLDVNEIEAVESSIKTAASTTQYNTAEATARSTIIGDYNKGVADIETQIEKISERLAETKDEDIIKELKKKRTNLKTKQTKLRENLAISVVQQSQAKTNLNIEALEKLAESESYTDKAAAAILTELTRPVFGATSGAIFGLSTREDASDMENVYVSAIVGAGLGVAAKRIGRSDKITTEIKDSVKMKVNEAGFNYNKINLKTFFGGGTATRMESLGGWNKAVSNLLFSRYGSATDSVEARALKAQADWIGRVNNILEGSGGDDDVLEAVGEAMYGFIPEGKLVGWKGLSGARKALTEEQANEVRRITPLLQESQDFIKNRVASTGIKFEELDFYGMRLTYDLSKVTDEGEDFFKKGLEEAIKIHNKNVSPEKQIKSSSIFIDSVLGKNSGSVGKYQAGGSSVFSFDNKTKKYTFRRLSEMFETTRRLTDPEAIQYLAKEGLIVLNARDVVSQYGSNSLKIAEFAETFGPNGEVINVALNKTKEAFKGKNEKAGERYTDQLVGGVEAFWSGYGNRYKRQAANDAVRLGTTLANTSYLTLVSFANLVDLTQPFLKSGFGAATKSIMQKNVSRVLPSKLEMGGKSFAEMSNFQYDKSFERELETLLKARSVQDNTRMARFSTWANNRFFEIIQLKNVTSVARKFAYDTGVNRAYDLSQKFNKTKKTSKVLINELEDLGLTVDDLRKIGTYSTVQEAFEEANARTLLDTAGRKAAERDSIIPNVGNRLLFSQTQDPIIRSVGQFLSWSQAKSSELNAMLDRIENGDTKILLRMAASIPLYVGFEELRQTVAGLPDREDRKVDPEEVDGAARIARGLERTGMFSNFQIAFFVDQFRYVFGSESFNVGDALSPAIAWFSDAGKAGIAATEDFFENRDAEGAAAEILSELPVSKQIMSATQALTGKPLLEDEPNRKDKEVIRFEKGGEVNIERAASEPDERIDKMTGMPYDQQAGTAFIDEEDPLRRLGFVGGGEVDPLRRLGFGV